MTENHGPGAASTFLEALYGTADEDLWILIWSLPDKQSRWFSVNGREAIGDAVQMIAGNVYLGAGLLAMPGRPDQRGERHEIAGIPGVWADIDYGSEGHQKSALPATMLDAARLIAELPAKPTVLVHSGHGFQAWWLFHEFWRFEDDTERDRGEALVRGWQAMIRGRAKQYGWTIDSTWDLPRVLRLPGTWNVKREPRQPVRLDELHNDLRYGLEELERLCPAVEERSESEPVSLGDLPSSPPFDKFNNLLANDDEFRKLWEHRKKLPDDSLSGYDLALANIAVKAAWSDDEIVGLLIAHRRRYSGGGPKHKTYYERTIGKARAGLERTRAEVQLEELHANGHKPDRSEVLDIATKQLGVPITGLIEITGATPVYRLETTEGSIMLGTASTLTQQSRFRTKLIELAGILPEPVKERTWVRIVNALLSIREQQSGGEENTERGVISDWLRAYLYQVRSPLDWSDAAAAVESKTPFYSQSEDLCIYSNALRAFINEHTGERVTRNELAALLRYAGCENQTFNIKRTDGTWTTTSAWVIPEAAYKGTQKENE